MEFRWRDGYRAVLRAYGKWVRTLLSLFCLFSDLTTSGRNVWIPLWFLHKKIPEVLYAIKQWSRDIKQNYQIYIYIYIERVCECIYLLYFAFNTTSGSPLWGFKVCCVVYYLTPLWVTLPNFLDSKAVKELNKRRR